MTRIPRLPRNVLLFGAVSLLADVSSDMVMPLLPAFLVGLGANAAFIGVVEGTAERLTDGASIGAFLAAINAKYRAAMTAEFQDPEVNGTYAVAPDRVFALSGDDFVGSPTRWRFPRP